MAYYVVWVDLSYEVLLGPCYCVDNIKRCLVVRESLDFLWHVFSGAVKCGGESPKFSRMSILAMAGR